MIRSWTPRFLERLTSFWRPREDSLRLTFQYDSSGIRLIRRTRRGKPAPRSDPGGRPAAADRIFLELRSRDGRTTYRQILRDPIPQSAEVFEPDGTIRSVPVRRPSGVFSVVIPSERRNDHLVILAGPAVELGAPGFVVRRERRGQTREIFRTRLTGG